MKKLIIVLLISIFCSGCNLIPRITFDSKGSTPQQMEKSLKKIRCKGDILLNEDGTIQFCTKGFVSYESNYEKKERKFTIAEKVGNFIRKLTRLGFWGLVIIAILFPGLLGGILTFLMSASRRVACETIRAIKKFRRESEPDVKESLDNYLRAEQSKETKKYISNIRKSE